MVTPASKSNEKEASEYEGFGNFATFEEPSEAFGQFTDG